MVPRDTPVCAGLLLLNDMKHGNPTPVMIIATAVSLVLMILYSINTNTFAPHDAQAQTAPNPVASTGGGGPGYTGFTRYTNDCTNGFNAAATYTPDPNDPTLPAYYQNTEIVTGPQQAGSRNGRLVGQARALNGATFTEVHPVYEATGKTIQFYVYTYMENTDPAIEYTIHGVDGAGNPVSAAPGQPAPQPYTLTCPANNVPPPLPGPQVPGNGNPPPVVALPPEDVGSTVRKDMQITLQVYLPTGPNGTTGGTPVVTELPVDFMVTNADHADDTENVTVNMAYKGADRWEGTYSTLHYPGTRYALTVWPKTRMKKTICHVGPASPHISYPSYECAENEGTIVVKSGTNFLDFSAVKVGPGDLNLQKIRDGHVDAQDLYQIVEYLRAPSRDNTEVADLNLDGVVTSADYDLAVWSLQNVAE